VFMKKIIHFAPDILVTLGLSSLGYGLFLFEPWVSYSVVGAVVFFIGVSLGRSD